MVKHQVILRGYGAAKNARVEPPLIVRRGESEFVPALLADLQRGADKTALLQSSAADSRALAKPVQSITDCRFLYQPVHRAFNLVVVEAVCERPGFPRLNPRDIVSAGFVVRRVAETGAEEAWHYDTPGALGWERVNDPESDPDPELRPRLPNGYPVALQQKLLELHRKSSRPAERVEPLFVAPPDVCEQAGRTLLYGVVPVTSTEEQSLDPETLVSDADVQTLLPEFLRAGSGNYQPNSGGSTISRNDVLAAEADPTGMNGTFGLFLLGLRALNSVWRVFDPEDETGKPMRALLDAVEVSFTGSALEAAKSAGVSLVLESPRHGKQFGVQTLGSYLENAVNVLITHTSGSTFIPVPSSWVFPDAGLAGRIAAEARRVLIARHQKLAPRVKRFDDANHVYRVRAFVRTRCSEKCPPEIHWSPPSEPFGIMPWWANGGVVHSIALPDPDDLKKMAPNVAFKLPPKLANLLNRTSPSELIKGKGSLDGPSLGWICSFSIPIITLVAFIVLNIFLTLFDLVFQWMAFFKICLPYPKPPPAPAKL